jgi:DUF4097 and DUF4098 domain-containing protein YvlB
MKKLTLLITYVLLTFVATVVAFSLVMATAKSAYADSGDRDSDSDRSGESTKVNETRPAKADGEVRISNLSGTVRIEGWDKNQVQVTGTLGPGVERLEITNDTGEVEIRVILPRRGHYEDNDGDADLVIEVPKASRVEVNTVSADVEAHDVTGPQELQTVSGGITLESKSADLSVKTVSGDVKVRGSAPKAHMTLGSISGEIEADDLDGELDAETVSGDLRVGHGRFTRVKASATSGDLRYEAGIQSGGNYDFHNVSGDIELRVSRDASARYDLSSFSGDIDNSFGPAPQSASKYGPGKNLRFVNGKGDAEVNAETLSGEIHLQD